MSREKIVPLSQIGRRRVYRTCDSQPLQLEGSPSVSSRVPVPRGLELSSSQALKLSSFPRALERSQLPTCAALLLTFACEKSSLRSPLKNARLEIAIQKILPQSHEELFSTYMHEDLAKRSAPPSSWCGMKLSGSLGRELSRALFSLSMFVSMSIHVSRSRTKRVREIRSSTSA